MSVKIVFAKIFWFWDGARDPYWFTRNLIRASRVRRDSFTNPAQWRVSGMPLPAGWLHNLGEKEARWITARYMNLLNMDRTLRPYLRPQSAGRRFVNRACLDPGAPLTQHWIAVLFWGPGAVVKAACLASRTSRVRTPHWHSSFKETKCFFPDHS